MYEERKEKFSFKSFFLTLLLVLLFIFLMLWLFPTKGYFDGKFQDEQPVYDLERLSVLYDEIFANNVERMKDAAIGYFTNERMPQKVGESKKLTLAQMYELHLVLKMKDKDGNPCDTEKSYVEMTKYTEEYRLKVNLSCGKDEDYIIVYLGCYSYCPGGICEKRVATPSNLTLKEEQKQEGGKGTTPQDNNKYYCRVVNGKYYDDKGNVVGESEYNRACGNPAEEKYYCKVVNGKYYDDKGNVVSKSEYSKACGSPTGEKYYCEVVNGKYYDNKGNVVSKSEYSKACEKPTEEKYYCEVVNGKYYDKKGNVVSKSEFNKSCNIVDKKYMYEYKKETKDSTTCTAWSNWQKESVKSTEKVKVETKIKNELTGYNTQTVQTGTKVQTITKKVTEKYVKEYTTQLVVVGTKQVKVGNTTKQVTEKVAVGTVEKYSGIGSGTVVPKDTATVKYKNVTANRPDSCSNCSTETKYTWEIWKVETVYDVVTKNVTVPVYKTVNVYESKEIPIYDYRVVEKKEKVTVPVYEDIKVPQYKDITYYRFKTCETKKGQVTVKWSYNQYDSDLISKGYKLTGNVKLV